MKLILGWFTPFVQKYQTSPPTTSFEMPSDNVIMPFSNTIDALIFSAYVIAALFFTIYICLDLLLAYHKQGVANDSHPNVKSKRNLQVFSTLATLSFSSLSYQMLKYLIVSYAKWAEINAIPLPQRPFGNESLLGSGDRRIEVFIWQWLTSSTLFQDFAQTICSNSARFWWTQQALLVTMGWSVFMSFEGEPSFSAS